MPLRHRHSFHVKLAAVAALVALVDMLFFDARIGATLGLFVLAWCGALAAAVPALRRGSEAAALIGAGALGLVMVDDPSLLAWTLAWTAVATAVLLPRVTFTDAGDWALRIAVYALAAPVSPLRDVARAGRLPGAKAPGLAAVRLLALPLVGGAVFLMLFAVANPIVGDLIAALEWPGIDRLVGHVVFCGAALVLAWGSLRPYWLRRPDRLGGDRLTVPALPTATLLLSLAVFNLLFAVQNGLDIAFLWSGAPLPAGVTLADYAHRGAYTLIATALLAGGFVLVVFSPGSAAVRSGVVRRLVVLWVAQNVLLVASSILRLLDYMDAYSLTVLRISALAWMALVGVGLVLVCWRLLAGRSAAWLVNANAAATLAVLATATVVDLGAVAATWNVRHARAARQLDLCYLDGLGASALLPLIELERRAGSPGLRERVHVLRTRAEVRLAERQADWHGWTWRGARRLARARVLAASLPPVRVAPGQRDCDGSLVPPPPTVTPPVVATPLTRGGAR